MGKKNRKSRAGGAPKGAKSELSLSQAVARFDRMHASEDQYIRRISSTESIGQSAWVYSAITFIAEHLMRTPQVVMVTGSRTPLLDHPLQKFIDNPTAYDDQNSSAKFRYAYIMELLLNGSVMRVLDEMVGFIPGKMTVRPRWHFRVNSSLDSDLRMVATSWELNRFGKTKKYTPSDTIYHDALYNPLHDFEGLAPLTAALLSVTNDVSITEFAARFFENDASTGTVFTTDNPEFNQKQADEAAKSWQAKWGGTRNAYKTKFVGFGLKPVNLGAPIDAKMLQTLRSFTREEIVSGIFKIPLDAISAKDGGGDIVIGGPSGGTQASAREAFLINVVQPWADRMDADFNRDITWRFDSTDRVQVMHDFSQNPILERRRLERAKAAVELVDRGVPLNEVINWMRLELTQQPWGNDWWIENTQLPARVVLDAGKDAIKIAIPDNGAPPASSKDQKQRTDEYISQVLSAASQIDFINKVRSDESIRSQNGNGNHNRIKALMGGVATSALGLPGGN